VSAEEQLAPAATVMFDRSRRLAARG
jgi:hypothetical protein